MIPDKLDLAIEWRQLEKGGLEQLEAYLQRHPDTGLVIVDTLAKLRSKPTHNGNAYAEDYSVGAQLKTLSDKYRVAILVVTHVRKAESQDPVEMVSGTLGLVGGMDGVLVLKRERGQDRATLYVTGRDVPEDRYYALNWDKATCRWAIEGDAKDVHLSQARKEILDLLYREKAQLSARQISERLGRKPDGTRRLLPDMVRDGLLTEIRDRTRFLYAHPMVTTSPPTHSGSTAITPPSAHMAASSACAPTRGVLGPAKGRPPVGGLGET